MAEDAKGVVEGERGLNCTALDYVAYFFIITVSLYAYKMITVLLWRIIYLLLIVVI